MSLGLAYARGRRRPPSLTPMIDVVFLLLVFFMLAARFGADQALALAPGGTGALAYTGPPRLVAVGPEGPTLNGQKVDGDVLIAALRDLTRGPDDVIVLRGTQTATTADLVAMIAMLRGAGFDALAVVE
ncbi:ExbD/TolR family protein [Roseivivax sp. CAU 1753]